MRRIAVINQKGGVGKTTVTTNLGHALALMGYRVTVIDLDPQGHLAASFGFFRTPRQGLDEVLLSGVEIESVKVGARDNLSLIPAGSGLNKVEGLIHGGASRARLLESSLKGRLSDQEFVILDCPPSSGILVTNAIFSADEVIIPVSGDYLSLNSLANMIMTLKKFEPYTDNALTVWIGMSRFVPRRRLSNEVLKNILNHFVDKVMATPIREAAVMAECPGAGRTIFEYRSSCRSAEEFRSLAQDLIDRRTM